MYVVNGRNRFLATDPTTVEVGGTSLIRKGSLVIAFVQEWDDVIIVSV